MKKVLVFILLITLTFTLVGCGLLDNSDVEKKHEHTYSTAWSSDETYHWHDANCEHTDLTSDKAAHSYNDDGYCTVCNAEDPNAQHKHQFSAGYVCDDTYHWRAATCEHVSETKDKAAHTFVEGKCSVCYALKPNNATDYPYEFGDVVSINNKSFYKDYSEQEKQLYYVLWSENTTVSVQIDISPYELSKINEAFTDYQRGNTLKADTYRKCNLTITVNGVSYYYEEVGIRMRGNTSRRYFTDSEGNINNFVHFRFSLSETFDGDEYGKGSWGQELYHDWSNDASGRAERKDRSFATMEKFYYKWNKNYDQTYIREVYANRMFQAYGILAPHVTLTQVSISQQSQMHSLGVGNLYEIIDKAFIKRNFDKSRKGGDLYKCSWNSGVGADLTKLENGLYGIETATQRFTYDLKTNDDRSDPDYNHHKYLKAFIEMLQTDKNAADFTTKLEAMVDMDYFARLEAVNYLLGNPDCIRNNSNNYYIYFVPTDDPTQSATYIIPYDYDRCLGANMDWNPQQSMVYATPYAISGWAGDCNNPLYVKTILNAGSSYRALYTAALKEVLNGKWFTYANFKQLFNAYKANYGNLAKPSVLIQQQCGTNLQMARFVFSETESSSTDTTENLTVQSYFTLKRSTVNKNIDK